MTTVKGKPNQNGEQRRYFNCTGKSHKRVCTGPKATIYADDLEAMIYDCITEKLSELMIGKHTAKTKDSAELNDLKLKIKTIEIQEKQLIDFLLSGTLNTDMIALLNQRASRLKTERLTLHERLNELRSIREDTESTTDLIHHWKQANYDRKKAVAAIMIHRIVIEEKGGVRILWNI